MKPVECSDTFPKQKGLINISAHFWNGVCNTKLKNYFTFLQTFVLDKAGKVIMSYQGPKGSDPKEHIKKSLEALKSQSGSSSGEGMANDASKAGQNAPTAGSMESLKNLPDEANDSYTGAETLK